MTGKDVPHDGPIDQPDGPPTLAPGTEIAPGYVVIELLRRGRDLDVYDLWSECRGCRCVGKTLRPDRARSRGARTRLLREGRLLRRLTHPHIVRAYAVLTDPVPLVILETLPGETLGHLVERGDRRLSERDIAQLGLHLCAAIGYLHRQNVLHLDLKPSNIIVSHGLAKVIDLSVARPVGRHRGGIGTVGYMAPEQIAGGYVGPASDVWGIGAVLYEMATGEPACDVGDDTSTALDRATVCRPAPVRRWRRLSAPLAVAIDRCLSLDPEERPSVAQLVVTLSAIAEPST